jgi:hypothetical protein
MPRKAGIDAAEALQHIVVRGIERRKIFRDDTDRDDFLDRLEGILWNTAQSQNDRFRFFQLSVDLLYLW